MQQGAMQGVKAKAMVETGTLIKTEDEGEGWSKKIYENNGQFFRHAFDLKIAADKYSTLRKGVNDLMNCSESVAYSFSIKSESTEITL